MTATGNGDLVMGHLSSSSPFCPTGTEAVIETCSSGGGRSQADVWVLFN
jgi:hypothetical protein